MHVHMSERSMGHERAREATHEWIRWQPCLCRVRIRNDVCPGEITPTNRIGKRFCF